MKKRVKNTKIGDVFEVKISDTTKRYIQYIVSDMTQLNSDVIRAFKREYNIEDMPIIDDIVADEIDFYSHTTTVAGIKNGEWTLFGNIQNVGDYGKVLFRTYSNVEIEDFDIRIGWKIWRINKDIKSGIKSLSSKQRQSYPGMVYCPERIVSMLNHTFVDFNDKYL